MGRPSKTGIDYFPHLVSHGETMFILEQRFGNDGYSAWFKILETLGTKETHSINCSNGQSSWEYLQAKTRLTPERLKEILDLLAKLGAIDPDLWTNESVIWSQHFVDNLREVYRKRKKELPVKPVFCRRNDSSPSVSVAEGTQSKVEESKVKKRREETHIGEKVTLPDWMPEETWSVFLAHRKACKAPVTEKAYPAFIEKFLQLKTKGWEPKAVVDIMIEKGWRWFKPEWIKEEALRQLTNEMHCRSCHKETHALVDGLCWECKEKA